MTGLVVYYILRDLPRHQLTVLVAGIIWFGYILLLRGTGLAIAGSSWKNRSVQFLFVLFVASLIAFGMNNRQSLKDLFSVERVLAPATEEIVMSGVLSTLFEEEDTEEVLQDL